MDKNISSLMIYNRQLYYLDKRVVEIYTVLVN